MSGDEVAQIEMSEPAVVQLAKEIRRLRKVADLSDAVLAARIGYSRQYISMAQRVGKNLPSKELVKALDKVLNAGGELVVLRERARAEQLELRQSVNEPDGPAASVAVGGSALAEHVERSQREWLRVRSAPGVRGRELTELAAWLYPESQRAPGGHVLTGPDGSWTSRFRWNRCG